jgi:hypothetical protein
MIATNDQIKIIEVANIDELRSLLGDTPLQWLKNLGQPTWISIPGKDQSRSRAIVTLLHANEPSGLKALHDFFCSGRAPETNLGIFVASVEAALHAPAFSHRYFPHEQDLNRCFDPSQDSNQHRLAMSFVQILSDFAPEAVIDTHNTSGHSEPFAVVAHNNTTIHQVAQIFTRRLVVIGQPMGTLIEQDIGCPIVTVEFGGFLDPNADELAKASLAEFIMRPQLFAYEPEPMQVLANPLRLQVSEDTRLHYATTVYDELAVTMFNTIDQLNFHTLVANTSLGWMPDDHEAHLRVIDGQNNNVANQLFLANEGVLKTRVAMTIFMATTDADIAKHDCLLYLCPEDPL